MLNSIDKEGRNQAQATYLGPLFWTGTIRNMGRISKLMHFYFTCWLEKLWIIPTEGLDYL